MFWVYAALAVSLVSFFVAAYFYNWVKKLPTANPKLDEVGALIREGAFTFLRREYRVLGLFSIIVMAVIFLFFPQPVWAGAGIHPEIFYGGLPRRRGDGHGRHRHFSGRRGAHLYHLP